MTSVLVRKRHKMKGDGQERQPYVDGKKSQTLEWGGHKPGPPRNHWKLEEPREDPVLEAPEGVWPC